VVPTFFQAGVAVAGVVAGIASVVQTTQADAPGRFEMTFFEISSIFHDGTPARVVPGDHSPNLDGHDCSFSG